jgi:hypothetical protein
MHRYAQMLDDAVVSGTDQPFDKIAGGIRGHLVFRFVASPPDPFNHLQSRRFVRQGDDVVGRRNDFQGLSPLDVWLA